MTPKTSKQLLAATDRKRRRFMLDQARAALALMHEVDAVQIEVGFVEIDGGEMDVIYRIQDKHETN